MKSLTELDQGKTIVYCYTRDGKTWTYHGEVKGLDVTPEAGDEVDLVDGGRYVYTEDGEWLEAKDHPVIDGKEKDKKAGECKTCFLYMPDSEHDKDGQCVGCQLKDLKAEITERHAEIGRLRARMEHADILFKRCKSEEILNVVAMIEMVGFEKAMGASIAADKESENAKD